MLVKYERKRSRAHQILFSIELPFKPRRVESKIQYKRKQKHPNREQGI